MAGKIHFVSAGAGSGKTHRLTEILPRHTSRDGFRFKPLPNCANGRARIC